MYANQRLQYQKQAILTSSPEQLVAKLYDIGIKACHQGDRSKVRAVLVELLSSLNHEKGGEVAGSLQAVYEFCLNESATGELDTVSEMLDGLREAWHDGVLGRKAA